MRFTQKLSAWFHSDAVQLVFKRYSLAQPRNQQVFAIFLSIVMGMTIVGSFAWSWAEKAFAPVSDRNFLYVPFNEYDAELVCSDEIEKRLGEKLLRTYVDAHSTRLDNRDGTYRVYIVADVGEIEDFHEVMVYCFIDKWDHRLSYYKEVDPENKGIMTSDIKFFKN